MKPPSDPGLPKTRAIHMLVGFGAIVLLAQAALVAQARPQDLLTGLNGMADILSRAWPPDFSKLPHMVWATLETVRRSRWCWRRRLRCSPRATRHLRARSTSRRAG
jgi:ABC-type phosphate/phosphonate transport system permease subunit